MKTSKFYLVAETKGKVKSSSLLSINVCGDEQVKLTTPGSISIFEEVGASQQERDMSKLFNSDHDNSPVTKYTLLPLSETGSLDNEQSRVVTLTDNNLKIDFSTYSEFGFLVRASTDFG